MSDLNFSEKRRFEVLLGMQSGYVLDFTNRTFAEFVSEHTGCSIFDARYDRGSGSKANRLRSFWQREENALVGKLMKEMLDYSEASGPNADACRQTIARLIGVVSAGAHQPMPQSDDSLRRQRSTALAQLRQELFDLAGQSDRARAGIALEKLLSRLFDLFALAPRAPFRVIGEQIDGSFELDGAIYLLESKWEKQPLPVADLLVFRGKIEGKSTFTRGVLIALNGVSQQASDALTRGKSSPFFVVDGHDLAMILGEAASLVDFLRRRVRLLAEEGRICVPFADLW